MATQVIPENAQLRSRPGFLATWLVRGVLAFSVHLEGMKVIEFPWQRDLHRGFDKRESSLFCLLINEEMLPSFFNFFVM